MNVTPKLKKLNKKFIPQYLKACGIEDAKRYLNPDTRCFDNPWDYKNMGEAVDCLNEHLKDKIGILMDSDLDGACSAALTVILLRSLGVEHYTLFSHDGKQHGVHDKMDDILGSDISLLIVPDAGSNDTDDCHILKSNGIDIIVLDHHMIEKPNPNAVIVNPHMGDELNNAISGTGVVYKFCEAYYNRYKGYEWAECGNTMDIVAVSLVGDVCDLSSLENRAFVDYGLNDPDNEFLCYLFEKKCTRRGVTPDGISWEVAPLANALARSDEQETKLLFFKALVGDMDFEDALKQINRVKRQQDNAVKAVVEEIEPTIDNSHKTIIGFSDSGNKLYLGLIANKFCGKYGKPTFLLRELNSTTWTGSMRSPVALAEKINDSGLAKAQGHQEACGITINKANLERFEDWLDALDLSEKPDISVTACVSPEDIDVNLVKTIVENKILWGKGVDAPTFYLRCNLSKDNVFIYEKSTTTIKVQLGNLACLKFFAKESDVEAFTENDSFEIEMVVGDCSVNEYMGACTPQAVIQKYEIHKKTTEKRWEDLF